MSCPKYALDGRSAKIFTAVYENARFYLLVWLAARWATSVSTEENDDDNQHILIPLRAGMLPVLSVLGRVMSEFVNASILGPSTISIHKRDQVFRDVQNPAMIFYLARMTFQFCAMTTLFAHWGVFRPLVIPSVSAEHMYGVAMALVVPYLEFWAMELIKDATSMHFVHRWMHDKKRYPRLNKLHSHHHAFKVNLNTINGAHILPLDLAIENSLGPVLWVFFKMCAQRLFGLRWSASISIFSYLLVINSEGSAHSCNPYMVCYYNPLVDHFIKGNIAHNLHHVFPTQQLHIVPWHHFISGYKDDLDQYNKVMQTRVQM